MAKKKNNHRKNNAPRDSIFKNLGLSVFGFLAILGIVFTFAIFRGEPASEPRQKSDVFIANVLDNKAIEAYELTSTVFQQNTAYKEMSEAVLGISALFKDGAEYSGEDRSSLKSEAPQVVITYTARGIDEIDYWLIVVLIEEAKQWNILNFTLEPQEKTEILFNILDIFA